MYRVKIAETNEYEPLIGSEIRKFELYEMTDSGLQSRSVQVELSEAVDDSAQVEVSEHVELSDG